MATPRVETATVPATTPITTTDTTTLPLPDFDLDDGPLRAHEEDDPLSPVETDPLTSAGDTSPKYARSESSVIVGPPANRELGASHVLESGRRVGDGWELSRIRWAPLHVPLPRRLQTLAVLLHTLSIALFVAAFFMCCSIPIFWPILLPYMVYLLFSDAASSGNLKYRSEFFRRSYFWSLFAAYFPAQLHKTCTLDPKGRYIFGYHPHGIISHGAFAAFATEALGFSSLFPGITNTLLTLDSNFRIPFYRDYALRLGLGSVSRRSCENLLKKGGHDGHGQGRAITIVVGGARESLFAQPGTFSLTLMRRKGFVKLAFRTGASLVPVLGFGENDLYEQVDPAKHPFLHRFQMAMKKMLGFTLPLFHARGIFNYDMGLLPYRRSVNIVVGKPITPPRITEHPSHEEVEELHRLYREELTKLWEDFADKFNNDKTTVLKFDPDPNQKRAEKAGDGIEDRDALQLQPGEGGEENAIDGNATTA